MTEALLYYLIAINIVTFLVYGIDKWKAKQGSWRISEATLLILAVIGGSIGALLGMKIWHHKTMHKKFKYGLPLILIIQIILIGYLNIEDYREYCLSLGTDVEEKLPFQKFKSGEGVLVFYVMGHMFSFFDCNDYSVISLKCQPERIEDLKVQYDCIGNPYNESPKHWIGINPNNAPDNLLQELTRNSYEIVKAKYTKK